MSYDEVKGTFENAGSSMRCSDVVGCLRDLGFEVEDGRRGGHKKFKHPTIPAFYGGSFNCGHGRNSEVRRCYIRDILRIIDEFEEEIKSHLRN